MPVSFTENKKNATMRSTNFYQERVLEIITEFLKQYREGTVKKKKKGTQTKPQYTCTTNQLGDSTPFKAQNSPWPNTPGIPMRTSETLNFKSQFSDPKGNAPLSGGPWAMPSTTRVPCCLQWARPSSVPRPQNTWISLTAEQKLLHRTFVGKHLYSAGVIMPNFTKDFRLCESTRSFFADLSQDRLTNKTKNQKNYFSPLTVEIYFQSWWG